jgi:hypothetical protein
MGDQRKVACLHLDRFGVHTLGHISLEIRINRSILCRNSIEAWLRTPSGPGGSAHQKGFVEGLLDSEQRPCLGWGKITGKIAQERFLS